MSLLLLLALPLQLQSPPRREPADSTPRADSATGTAVYATPALRALIGEAVRRNQLPRDLLAYRARAESEITILSRRPDGAELPVSTEQVGSVLRWVRTGRFDQHVVGYRAQQMGLNISMLAAFRRGFVTPTLYGNRMRLRSDRADESGGSSTDIDATRATTRREAARQARGDTIEIVHPLAADRDRYYRYGGGDTVVTLRAGARAIPIVRVTVEPVAGVSARDRGHRYGFFRGEIEIDAERQQVVRMRGHFLRVDTRGSGSGPSRLSRLVSSALTAIGYVEYVNGEVLERYWLPSYQRIELQIASPLVGDARAIVRIVTHMRGYAINDTTLPDSALVAADSMRLLRPTRTLTYASNDTIGRFGDWWAPLGEATAAVHSDDFADVAPDFFRSNGAPRLDVQVERATDLVRFNRVEGLFTGLGATLRMRDRAPGVTLRATAGYAWAEHTVRGRVSAERVSGPWQLALRAGRSLDLTNDFRSAQDSGSALGALLATADEYDYVDRWSATAAASRFFGGRRSVLRLELGPASDRPERTRIARGLFVGDSLFRPNRGVVRGNYLHSAAVLEFHPDVTAEFVRPGVGARLAYERGDLGLEWQRIEGRVTARTGWHALSLVGRVDGGVVAGKDRLPQQLFELGAFESLPGYDYKEFAGDRAAVARGYTMLALPVLRAPIRLTRRYILPGPTPALSAGIHAGWAEASGPAAQTAIALLGSRIDPVTGAPMLDAVSGLPVPVSRPTDGWRATVSAGMRFFGGSVFLGVARPVDHSAPWKGAFGIGGAF